MKANPCDNLDRATPLSRDISEVRVQIVAQLIEDYGLAGRSEQETLWGLVFALCADHIPAFTYSKNRSGPKRKVQDPYRVFVVVNAILDVAKGHPRPVGDPTLQRLVDLIGQDIRVNRRGARVASICKRLREEKRSPWYRQSSESIRANYYAAKKRNDELRRGLKAATDAAASGSLDAASEAG